MEHKANLNIVFIGTPEFGAIILEKLVNYMPSFVLSPHIPSFTLCFRGPFQPTLVITAPDRPAGRKQILTPPPVKILAEKYRLPILQPEKIKNYKFTIESYKPDLIVVAGYSQIIPKDILEIPKYGALNVHPSLLPRWRGPSPIQFTILAGDKKAGVTIILMDEKMDHGPILASSEFQVMSKQINYRELENILANLGAKLLTETIPKWVTNKIQPQPQDDLKATYSIILKKEDGKINWEKPALEIERQIRAFKEWPGSFCFWPMNNRKIRLKILRAVILPQKSHGPFGVHGKTFLAPDNKIAVQTGKDFLIIEELQPEGKKPQNTEEFLRGRPDFIGTILE